MSDIRQGAEERPVPAGFIREPAFWLAGMQVSPASGELLIDGRTVMVQPRIMQVLVALARRRGEVVSRDELIHVCWGGRVVGEDAINRCIQAIRRIARAQGGFAVKTVARVGYRLVETSPAPDRGLVVAAAGLSEPSPFGEPAPPHAEPKYERRHLTVLSCNLVRRMGAALPVDPEEWRAISQRYRRVVTQVVAPFGGHVAKGLGDNLTVYFGYPEAREDAAECAVRAGLAIVDELAAPKAMPADASDIGLAVRIGVHAGVVVIAQGHDEVDMFGEAPDVAAHVQIVAEPGTVAVTSAVHALVAGLFVLEEPQATPFAGGDGPIHFHRVVSPVSATRRPRFTARQLTPYVGREDELHLLSSRWKRARRGEGQLVMLIGEPGIGKTRLVQEFRKRIEGEPHMWIECAGERLLSNTPFHAVAKMLEQGFRWRGDESPRERLDALELALERSGLQAAEMAPLVGELLNLDLPDGRPPLTLAPDEKRKRLLAALTAWVFSLARAQPLIIVVEDLHWVDPSTMQLLVTLVEQGATAPLMILCTARPEFRAGWPVRSHHAQITLDRLSPAETQELVMGVAAQAGLSQDMIDAVIARTDGVPLFAEELTRLMLESDGRAGPHEIPATLHDSLAARLDRTGSAKEVAQLGAVLGREFSYALIAAVSALPAEQLQTALSRLADAELIYVRGHPPDAHYQFKHALILDVAYEALLKGRRRELHALVAHTISERFPALAQDHPEVLAGHWSEAGEPDKAVSAWVRAASAASARHAYNEAIQNYRQALAMLATLPAGPERDARELELLVPLSEIVGVLLGYPSDAYLELHERGAVLATKGGGLPQLVIQMMIQFVTALTSGQQVRATEVADRLLDLATREGSDASLRMAHMAQLTGRHGVGDFVGAEAHFEIWSGIVARSGHGPFLGETAAVYGAAIETAFQLGRADLAYDRLAEAMAVAQASQSPFEIMVVLLTKAWLCVLLKDAAAAADAAAQALVLAEAHGFNQAHQIRSSLAWAKARMGDTADAVALAESCLAGWVGGGLPRLAEARRVLAEVQALDGATADALAGLDALCAAPTENPAILCAHLICRAELLTELGRAEAAETDLRAAIGLAQPRHAKAMELRASTLLARLLHDRGDAPAARDLLAPACDGFSESQDTADLTDARALLEQLAADHQAA